MSFSPALNLTILFLILLSFPYTHAVVYDYCSITHSAHVLERIEQEVLPVYSRFKVALKRTCPFNAGLLDLPRQ